MKKIETFFVSVKSQSVQNEKYSREFLVSSQVLISRRNHQIYKKFGDENPFPDATTLSITTLSIIGLVMTLSIDIQHNSIECNYAECLYADCIDYLNVMMSVVNLNVVM